MSDEFFVLLVEKFANPEFQNLGVLLGISEKQNSNIFADTDFPNYQYKVLHVSHLSNIMIYENVKVAIVFLNNI